MSGSAANALARARVSLSLLTERRGALYASVGGFFLFTGVMMALLGGTGSGRDFWLPLYLLPALFLAVPMMSDAVAVERRSGTLDLALTSPGGRLYFERRVGAVAVLMVAQGWFAVVLARAVAPPFSLTGPFLQVVTVTLFLTSATLAWALYLKNAGAVMVATYASVLTFAPWFFSNPIHPPTEMNGPMTVAQIIDYLQQNLVLGAAAAVFYLYALRRLSQPESIIQ